MADTILNKFIEDFTTLPLEEKEYLIDIMQKQLVEAKRDDIARRTKECMDNFQNGSVKKGTVKDLYEDLEND
jgi:hypothetical protein